MNLKRLLNAYLPVLLWMSIIFIGSTDVGSPKSTSRIIGPILRWFKPDVSDETISNIQLAIRKTAHVTIYSVLAGLIWRGRRVGRGAALREGGWSWPEMWAITTFCALYAVTDELHQKFVKSRGPSAWDVGLDVFGATLALLAIWALGRHFKRW